MTTTPKKLTIPQIREEMLLMASRLEFLANETNRRPPVRKAHIEAIRVTYKMAREIRQYAEENPKMSYKRLANIFGVNPGRISEILAGKRGE